MFRRCLTIAAVVLATMPATAQADWLFSPGISYPFAGDTLGRDHVAWTAAFGWVDEEGFGIEGDLGFAPQFFNGNKEDFTGTGNLLTLMGNVLLTGPPDRRLLPYVTGGAGYMQMRVTSDEGTFTSTTREFGLNAGAGIFAFFRDNVGLRGELRYLRSFQDQPPSWTRGVDVDIAPGAFDFFRATLSVTIRGRE